MMRRAFVTVLAAMGLCLAGCKMSPSEINAMSEASGVAATVIWMSYDNPSVEQKTEVSKVLGVVTENIGIVGTNSYASVFMPKVMAYVAASQDIPAIDKPLVIAGSLAVFGGIDLLFASHPEWKADTQNVGSYVKSFISGVQTALALPATDSKVMKATENYKARSALKK
jgi:hypothetical protein